jgi:hypothetical protein
MEHLWDGLAGATLGAVVGAIVSFFVAQWTARREQREHSYIHTDAQYAAVLRLYLEYPEFSAMGATQNYATAFPGKELLRYSTFAALVHDFLETIFDLFHDREKDRIIETWATIFAYHARLDAAWLMANPGQYEASYVDFVRRQFTP